MLLSTIIQRFSTVRVLCIGDVMLDHFVYGRVNRLSPEAPVPVFNRESDKFMLGGAGNVLANAASLGCQVDMVCLLGDDAPGSMLDARIREVCPEPLCMVEPDVPTIEKTRIIAGNHHLIRIDTEGMPAGNPFSRQERYSELASRIRRAGIVLLSDYGKGFLSPETCRIIMTLARDAGKPVLVDPKGSDYEKYAGAALVKPNLKEFMQAGGVRTEPSDPDFKQKLCDGARTLMRRGGFDNLLITLSEHGMFFVGADASIPPVHMATQAREVIDVTGAGDTCLAVLGTALGAGADIAEAMKLANLAAGIVVGKLGTAVVSAAELTEHLFRGEVVG
ncbi:PfkB family carbohydrate kinase [uncultured Mailhella sp.]|uniref:bifunctional heptose 7-phosphate kinase/heptose 1-phosphate adenyltransferase n=1 Tax=uncultured Mailhella sp. TaxID=1981031 RepID=UPI0026292DA1|nr:PfkB family carbohydrate kinase [uncultured Mailhella sp.]